MFAITAAPCSKLSDYAYPIYPTHPHIIHPAHKLSISILNIPSKFSKYFSLGWDHDHNIFSYFNVEQKVEMFQTNCPQTENYCLHETADRAQTNKIIGLFAINSERTSL